MAHLSTCYLPYAGIAGKVRFAAATPAKNINWLIKPTVLRCCGRIAQTSAANENASVTSVPDAWSTGHMHCDFPRHLNKTSPTLHVSTDPSRCLPFGVDVGHLGVEIQSVLSAQDFDVVNLSLSWR